MAGRGLFERLEAEGWQVIDEMIAERLPESISLEFKDKASSGASGRLHDDDKKNLAKSISAFANTDGGCLIFGITTERSNSNPDRAKAVHAIGDLQRFTHSVEAVLKDVVNPSVPGIRLHAVADKSGADSGVLAIYIPQSLARPHRANMGPGDIREHYYQRSASRSDIMPHSILAALMGRVPVARLYLAFNIWFHRPHVRFSVELGNRGRGSARQPAIRLYEVEPALLTFWSQAFGTTELADGWRKGSNSHPADAGDLLLSSSRDIVVYPGDRTALTVGEGGKIPGGYQWGGPVSFPIKGIIYAADAAPVEFEQRIEVAAVRDPRISFYLPSDDDWHE